MSSQSRDDFSERLHLFFQSNAVIEDQDIPPFLLKAGGTCPACGRGMLEYDGALNLICESCGAAASGGGACT